MIINYQQIGVFNIFLLTMEINFSLTSEPENNLFIIFSLFFSKSITFDKKLSEFWAEYFSKAWENN